MHKRTLPFLLVGAWMASATGALAQTAAAPSATPGAASDAKTQANDSIVTLNPFEVKTDKDNSYGALQSSSLSAFAMDLQKMPATAEVFTSTFIDDTQSMTIEDMLTNYSGIVGYTPGDTAAYTESAGDRDGGGGLSIRGFGNSGGIKFDGFFGPPSSTRSAGGSTPTFMVDRVEVVEGPQSLLYGAIGAGGVINATYKKARFDDTSAMLRYRFNDLGSKMGEMDYNVGTDNVAVRFAATNQTNKTVRQNLGNQMEGFYVQAAIKLPGNTIVRLIHNKYETQAWNGFTPSVKGTGNNLIPSSNPLSNDTTGYLAATGQIPAGIFGGVVNWNNVSSFDGVWSMEPSTITNNSLEIETAPTKWLSAKVTAIYNYYTDWRNTTSTSLVPPGTAGDPYSTFAIEENAPKLNFQSQRQRAIQFNLLASNDFFHGNAHSETVIGGYYNHLGPSFGSSGIDYNYIQADSNWNPTVGTGTADYGHTLMGALFFPVTGGQIMKYGLFQPGASRVTLNGVNYILQPRIQQSKSAVGLKIPGVPTNPFGLVPNGSNNLSNTAPGGNFTFSGTWNQGTIEHEEYLMFGNYTDWFGGKLSTLAGVSVDRATSMNFGATSTTYLPWARYNGFEVGIIGHVLPWLSLYGNLGTAATPAGSTNDLYGQPLHTAAAKGVPEVGMKATSLDGKYSAQLAWDIQTQDQNEIQSTDGSYQNSLNPNGINGRFGGGQTNNFVNVDRTATALEYSMTAQPTPHWRMRLNMSYLFVRVLNNVSYNQLYNDQFNSNSSGQVTYGNGQVVYVNGNAGSTGAAAIVTSTTPGAVPLTTALLNNTGSAYYAAPDPTSGTITNSTLHTLLTSGGAAGSVGVQQVAANGPIATGVTGLPLSKIQYAFTSPFPNNSVPIFLAGNPTTGYPGWQWNFQTDYTISNGLLKGLGFFASASAQYSTRSYYTFYPNTTNASLGSQASNQVNEGRVLVVLPTISNVILGTHYEYKFKRFTFKSSLNVSNAFNHDKFYVQPQSANGTFLQITQRVPTRLYTWSNEVRF